MKIPCKVGKAEFVKLLKENGLDAAIVDSIPIVYIKSDGEADTTWQQICDLMNKYDYHSSIGMKGRNPKAVDKSLEADVGGQAVA